MGENGDRLDAVLERLSQRTPIDWGMEATAEFADERLCLDALEQLDRMARFHCEGPLPAPGSEAPLDATLPATSAGSGNSNITRWGSLNLLERMGQGAFGAVYRAWDTRLNRQVALKLLHGSGDASAESMLEEARLLARVEHPNIVRIHGAEVHDGQAGIWMEFVEGTDLARLAEERGQLGANEIIALGTALCEALESVHLSGVVHQDIKLQNLMLRRDGRLVLMDFGAGRRRTGSPEEANSISGTPRYLAPELLAGATPSPQSDLWSIGVVLFRLLSGRFPVEGSTMDELFTKLRAKERTSLADVASQAPTRLVSVIERALHFDPKLRFASAADMASALRRAQGRRRVRPHWLLAAALGIVTILLVARPWTAPHPLTVESFWSAIGSVERPLVAGDAIAADEQLRLRLSLNRDAYVYVLNRDETGSTTLLHPSRDAASAKLSADTDHWLPGAVDGRELAWTLSAEAGLESFLVIASTEPMREFEAQLAQIAAVDLGEGIVVRPLQELALNTLTRGVTGVSELAKSSAPGNQQDLFDLARTLSESSSSKSPVRLSVLVLRNTGGG